MNGRGFKKFDGLIIHVGTRIDNPLKNLDNLYVMLITHGMMKLHVSGILHRDMKASNIIMGRVSEKMVTLGGNHISRSPQSYKHRNRGSRRALKAWLAQGFGGHQMYCKL
jgi:serine/threonine protein kinase